jgi:cellulose synthase/poly-beta-1,6-N-acetylglucosamine synthase-like glycosyltransferase
VTLLSPFVRRLGAAGRRSGPLAGDLLALSGGKVVGAPPSGPVLAGRRNRPRQVRAGTFVPVLSTPDRVLIAVLTVAWIACLAFFWSWWLLPEHRVGWVGLVVNSLLLAYVTSLPLYFVVAVNRLREVRRDTDVPRLRVAFVVTRAPSEDWDVARRTLEAMIDQQFPYPYDIWLCDEDPPDHIADWSRANGVHVSTRRGVEDYHRLSWPRRTRCKEGNLAFFYDHWGYRKYDVVAQLDCDHVPEPTYLAEMVRPFGDPAIGYVGAPSVCDANATVSWSARGRLHREATFHGPVQTGHNDGLAPVCIGSHYAVRTAALRDIGGIGPELAEDFSTAFLLNSAGWQGAFAHRAEAHGDGPLTFAAMLTQEFQWSRSLTTVLLDLVPRHLPRMPWRLRLRFGNALMFYGLLALSIAGGMALPPVAAITGVPWVDVNYLVFLAHWWPMSVCLVLITLFLRRRGLLRPARVPILCWETWLYALTRWPYIAWGVCAAVMQRVRPKPITFKVTPKSSNGMEPLPTGLVSPFMTVSIVLSVAALVGEFRTAAVGYIGLCLLGGLTYAVVSVAVCLLHAREAAHSAGARFVAALATARGPLLLAGVGTVPLVVALVLYPPYAFAVLG